jgi:hypothetical protein
MHGMGKGMQCAVLIRAVMREQFACLLLLISVVDLSKKSFGKEGHVQLQ